MTLIVTSAGLGASLDAANKGIKLKIKKIGFGSAGYVPNKDQTSLKAEFLRTEFTDSSISSNTLNMNIVFDDLNQVFDAKEVGYYLEDDTLFAVDSLNGAIISSKHKGSILTESFELVLSDNLIDSITVDVIGVSRATENNVGIAKIATVGEAGDANNDADIVTPKKMLMTLGDRGIAGSGCLDSVSLNSNERGSILFSDERSSITINSAKYLFSSSVVEIETSEILLEKLVGNISRKDFVYVTSDRQVLVLDGTDDSSDHKTAFSKAGFVPVSGDPLLYKKGEVYALAIGFIQRVGDTYFSSKLPSAAPKIEPKLIDCWFDLRLSAHKQDVNVLREKAIRSAVAGELRGKGKVPFTAITKTRIDRASAAASFGRIGLIDTEVDRLIAWFDLVVVDFVLGGACALLLNPKNGAIAFARYVYDNGTDNRGFMLSGVTSATDLIYNINDENVHELFKDLVNQAETRQLKWHNPGNTGHASTQSFGDDGDEFYVIKTDFNTITAEFDTMMWTDIIGSPANIAATFPNGVIGMWIQEPPNFNQLMRKANRKFIANGSRIRTQNNGATWSTLDWDAGSDVVSNEIRHASNNETDVSLIQYKTLSRFTEKSNNSIVIGSIGDVTTVSYHEMSRGCGLAYSTCNVILKSTVPPHMGRSIITNNAILDDLILSNAGYEPMHHPIRISSPNNYSHAVKALNSITEKCGLLYLQLHGCELTHNGTSWGDDSKVPIISGEGTKTDKNGNVVKTFCHHSLFPIGIADSQTLASLKIDNRANISDGINSGLHFDCLDDVPEPIQDFYYEIEDDLGLIRVYKYPHPHENGGHISDENIASWQFHDDFKNWLQTCAEIKFNASQAGEESERVPLPPMPIKSNYIGEKQ